MCGGFPNGTTKGEHLPQITFREFLWARLKPWLAKKLHRWDNSFWVWWLFLKHKIGH